MTNEEKERERLRKKGKDIIKTGLLTSALAAPGVGAGLKTGGKIVRNIGLDMKGADIMKEDLKYQQGGKQQRAKQFEIKQKFAKEAAKKIPMASKLKVVGKKLASSGLGKVISKTAPVIAKVGGRAIPAAGAASLGIEVVGSGISAIQNEIGKSKARQATKQSDSIKNMTPLQKRLFAEKRSQLEDNYFNSGLSREEARQKSINDILNFKYKPKKR